MLQATGGPVRFRMAEFELIEEELTRSVIGAFFEVYNTIGFGFLEHIYVSAMDCELRNRGHRVARETPIQVRYKGGRRPTRNCI